MCKDLELNVCVQALLNSQKDFETLKGYYAEAQAEVDKGNQQFMELANLHAQVLDLLADKCNEPAVGENETPTTPYRMQASMVRQVTAGYETHRLMRNVSQSNTN
jgi:hypothetical protein